MNILLINHYAGSLKHGMEFRPFYLSREWVKQGHDVIVLTGIPNHPTGIIPAEYQGKIFMKETVDGIQIWRHWLYATSNEGFFRKTFAHFSFMITIVFFASIVLSILPIHRSIAENIRS